MASWLSKLEGLRRKKQRQFEAGFQDLSFSAAKRTHSWTYVDTLISFSPSEIYPWDRGVAQEVSEYTKGQLRPIWITDVYKTPWSSTSKAEVEKFGRHGLAQKCKSAEAQFWFEGQGYRLWYQWTGEKDKRAGDIPGAYIPFDGRVMKLVKLNWRDWTKEQIRQLFRDNEAAYDAKIDHNDKMAAELEKNVQSYTQKKLENASEIELRDYFLGREYNKPQAQQYADLGSTKTE